VIASATLMASVSMVLVLVESMVLALVELVVLMVLVLDSPTASVVESKGEYIMNLFTLLLSARFTQLLHHDVFTVDLSVHNAYSAYIHIVVIAFTTGVAQVQVPVWCVVE
jgi:hypothetical protein